MVHAARSPAIQRALQHKVSRERVCKELEGMLLHSSARPALSGTSLVKDHTLKSITILLILSFSLTACLSRCPAAPPAVAGHRFALAVVFAGC